ncbi:uracil phosphoribosyltransferase [Mollicutes bacterium LVI A0078]|nr:uracil phosphoribosyltransferase [Mollicutes bacterium LVI A0075]WOO91654.1 uracil phosphoribosyltransferase [Mollicutes bacterium LVI A0078]
MAKVLNHPLIQHKVSLLREEKTTTYEFRKIVSEISGLMVYEVTRDLPLTTKAIKTPIIDFDAPFIDGKKMVIVPILRAGLGMVEGITNLVPTARIGHVGLYRDEETLEAVEYFAKFPDKLDERDVFVVDPMLATGGSSIMAVDKLKERGAKSIKLICLVGCPEGVEAFEAAHPDVDLYLAALDEKLNEKGYIVPGLGDAGDRIFGTK